MPGCRNRIGRPLPRSIASRRHAVDHDRRDVVAARGHTPAPEIRSCPLPIARPQALFQDCQARIRSTFSGRLTTSDTAQMNVRETPARSETRPGLTYATHDSVALAGDLYLPKGAGPFPALVAVHGGGWVQGARGPFQHWGPLSRRARHRAVRDQLSLRQDRAEDLPARGAGRAGGVQFVRGNAKEFKLDAERIGAVRPFRRRQSRRAGGARRQRSRRSPAAIRRIRTPRTAPRSRCSSASTASTTSPRCGRSINLQSPTREQHREVHRRVAAGQPPALFRRLADQLRHDRQQQDRGASERRHRGRSGRSPGAAPMRSCWRSSRRASSCAPPSCKARRTTGAAIRSMSRAASPASSRRGWCGSWRRSFDDFAAR